MHKRGLCRHAVSVRLCVSVMFVDHVKTNKHIYEIFSPSGSHAILVFCYQMEWRYSDGNPPNRGIECRWGRHKSRFWAYIWLMPAVSAATSHMLSTELLVEHDQCTASCDTSLAVSGGVDCERRRRNVYDKKSQHYAKDNITVHLTARSDKSVITNNKRLYSTFCTVEANYWQTRRIARPLCDSRATCLGVHRM